MTGATTPAGSALDLALLGTGEATLTLHHIGDMGHTGDIMSVVDGAIVCCLVRRLAGTQTIHLGLVEAYVIGIAGRGAEAGTAAVAGHSVMSDRSARRITTVCGASIAIIGNDTDAEIRAIATIGSRIIGTAINAIGLAVIIRVVIR